MTRALYVVASVFAIGLMAVSARHDERRDDRIQGYPIRIAIPDMGTTNAFGEPSQHAPVPIRAVTPALKDESVGAVITVNAEDPAARSQEITSSDARLPPPAHVPARERSPGAIMPMHFDLGGGPSGSDVIEAQKKVTLGGVPAGILRLRVDQASRAYLDARELSELLTRRSSRKITLPSGFVELRSLRELGLDISYAPETDSITLSL